MNIIFLILLLIIIVLLVFLSLKIGDNESVSLIDLMRDLLQSELKENRAELSAVLKDNREEFSNGLEKLTTKLEDKFTAMSEGIYKNAKDSREQLGSISEGMHKNATINRGELTVSLKNFSDIFNKNVSDFNELQKQKFNEMASKQDQLVKSTELKLDKMRETVDEKLHKTLEDRLGQSFKIVSDRLEAVQKGLGEMQSLANGVGDLKKVLSNVKTRGVLGEIQLGNILEQIMAPEQYQANVKTKEGSNDHVEFAIKLPGKDQDGKEVYLPIDAKFPQENYVRLQTAYDLGDAKGIEEANRALVQSIKKFAKDIHAKYIDPPNTTDFGIMFLPLEGLFAEVVRQPEVVATLQRDYKIIITGPTTLAAFLNSLQMGFKTMAIQKRSSEVWQVLSAVKTEFGKFGGVLEKAQRKINEANHELDNLVGTRTRMMMSKLKKVEELPSNQSLNVLDSAIEIDDNEGQLP